MGGEGNLPSTPEEVKQFWSIDRLPALCSAALKLHLGESIVQVWHIQVSGQNMGNKRHHAGISKSSDEALEAIAESLAKYDYFVYTGRRCLSEARKLLSADDFLIHITHHDLEDAYPYYPVTLKPDLPFKLDGNMWYECLIQVEFVPTEDIEFAVDFRTKG